MRKSCSLTRLKVLELETVHWLRTIVKSQSSYSFIIMRSCYASVVLGLNPRFMHALLANLMENAIDAKRQMT